MAEQPVCTCGSSETEQGGKKRIIFACSGASNTGQLSNEAAVRLTNEGYGTIACTASLAIQTPPVMKKTKEADEVVIIDGCPVGCAKEIAERAGIRPDQYIIVTEEGIKKSGNLELPEEEIEKIVSAAWERKGITEKPEKA